MAHYEFNGTLYSQASLHQREWGNKMINELSIVETAHILDLGCGDGKLTQILACRAKKGSVVGIDASSGMIEKAKEFLNPNIQFILMDINEMHFENQFNLVFSNAALHWVFDHPKLLDNCYKALKPGGKIRFNFAAKGNCETLFSVVRNIMKQAEFASCFTNFQWPWYMPTVTEYSQLLSQTKFAEVSVWEEDASRYFKNADEITRWIDQPSLVPFLKNINNPAKEKEFRDEVVQTMLRQTSQPDGTFYEKFYRINVMAEKPQEVDKDVCQR